MDTNDLINSLSQDLQPVKQLPAPMTRALVLSAVAAVSVTGMIFILGGPRPDWTSVLQRPAMMLGDSLMLTAGVFSAIAAFILSIPDTRIRKPVTHMLGFATLAWIGICLYAASSLTLQDVQGEFDHISESSACVKALVFMTVFPLVVSFFMAWRAAPVWQGWTGYALALSMASFGALGMRFFCPSDAYPHLLLWHFMPVLAISILGSAIGKAVLRFKL